MGEAKNRYGNVIVLLTSQADAILLALPVMDLTSILSSV